MFPTQPVRRKTARSALLGVVALAVFLLAWFSSVASAFAQDVSPNATTSERSASSAATPAKTEISIEDASVTRSAPVSADANSVEELDRRTRELRDQVFRSKARLTLLTEKLLGSAQGGARLVVVQSDQMGRLFQWVKVSYQLDGREVFVRNLDVGRIAPSKEQTIYDGNVRPGDHTLAVVAVYRGDGNKVFSYYDKYTFTAKAAHRFSATDGQTTRVNVVCREKGNPLLTRVEDRPSFDFRVESTKKAN